MKNRRKALTLGGLALAICLIPTSNAQAHDPHKWERHHINRHHLKHHAHYHKAKDRARHEYKHHKRMHNRIKREHYAYKKNKHKKIIVHNHQPTKVVYVYKERDNNYHDRLIAASIAHTAWLLAID